MHNDAICLFCGSSNTEYYAHVTNKQRIVMCRECNLARTQPYPVTQYEENPDFFENYLKNEPLFRSFVEPLVVFAQQFVNHGKLLEIGCSVGYFLDAAKKAKFDVEGIELNMKAFDYCTQKGLLVKNCLLSECRFPAGSFNIVVMNHVLEHIADLNSFLYEVHRILKPNGFLILSEPNSRGLVPRLIRKHWYGWAPNEHVWHFTPDTISKVMAKHSFLVSGIEVNSMYHGFGLSIVSMFTLVLSRIAGLLGKGDQFYVAAQKAG